MKYFLPIVLLFSACTYDSTLKSIDYNPLLHDGNSKVWLMNRVVVNEMNIAPSMNYDKELMIFHESGMLNMIPMKMLGEKSPKHAYFHVYSDEEELLIEFPKQKWIMKIEYITEDSIYFVPTDKSDAQFSFQLIPMSELE